METLNVDELFNLAITLDLPDLFRLCEVSKKLSGICKNKNLWIYKIKEDFPNYKRDFTILNADELKTLYFDIKKYALPQILDPSKKYYLLELYKAVEKGYNTKEEFEKFVKSVKSNNLILDRNFGIQDYIKEMHDKGLNPYRMIIYFDYYYRKIDYKKDTNAAHFNLNYFIIWNR